MSMRNGTRFCWATDTIALVDPESNDPISIRAPWFTTRSASTRPFSGLVWVSPTISSSLIPPLDLTPPAALIASAAICAPRRHACPGSASGPVTGWTTPSWNVFDWARSGSGKPATAPAAVDVRNVRRVSRCLVIKRLLARVASLAPSAAQELSGDDHALDLVRALVDLHDLRVPHIPLDRIVARVAIPAEDLDRVGRDLHRRVARPALRHRRFVRVAADAQVDLSPGVVDHQPS